MANYLKGLIFLSFMSEYAMRKSYAKDEAKSKSRQLVKGMIEKHILPRKKPKDITALILGGKDMMEVLEIYDPLGIPRKNITSIEMYPKIAEQQRKITPEVNIQIMNLDEYAKMRQKMFFDIYSLDFTSNINSSTLMTIAKYKLASSLSNVLFHIAMQKGREQKDGKAILDFMAYNSISNILSQTDDLQNEMSVMFDKDKKDDANRMSLIRNHSMTSLLFTMPGSLSIYGRKNDFEMLSEKFFGMGYDSLILKVASECEYFKFDGLFRKRCLDKDIDTLMSVPEIVDMANEKIKVKILTDFSLIIKKSMNYLRADKNDQTKLEFNALPTANLITNVISSLKNHKNIDFKEIIDFAKYTYVSQSGTPMTGIVAFYQQNHAKEQILSKLDELIVYSDPIRVRNLRQVLKLSMDYIKIPEPVCLADAGKPPVFLGNSSKPIIRKGEIAKLLSEGYSKDFIRGNYRIGNPRSISAIQAHLTRKEMKLQKNEERETLDV